MAKEKGTTPSTSAMQKLPALAKITELQAITIRIVSPETEEEARKYLLDLRTAGKDLKRDVVALKAPYKAAIEEVDKLTKPYLNWIEARDTEYERAILEYHRKVREATEAAQRKANEAFRRQVEKAAAKAEAEGKPMPLVTPPPVFHAPPKTVKLDSGTQTIVTRKAWRLAKQAIEAGITDADALTALDNHNCALGIPLEYFLLDTGRIGKIVRAGGTIPGIEVYEEESIANRT